jgi:aryl-alcohol dehydrogenase-like predicted oxidoreductase
MSLGAEKWQEWVVEGEEALQVLKAAWDKGMPSAKLHFQIRAFQLINDTGISIWDTANMYSNGLSEEIIGKAVKTFNIPRHKLVLITKCFQAVSDEISLIDAKYLEMRNTKDYINQWGKYRYKIIK